MPDVGNLIGIVFVDADGASSHLVRKHEASDEGGEDHGIDARRIPSFAKKRLGPDDDVERAFLE